jgi:hypothetical protein
VTSAPAQPKPAPVVATGGSKGPAAKSVASLLVLFKEKAYKNVANLRSVTQELKNEHLIEGVGLYMKLLDNQEAILKTMDACAKPEDMNFMVAIAKENK